MIFSLLLLTFGVGFAQLTASTNANPDSELPLLTRHPEFLHAGIAACCLLLGWSTTLSGKMIDRLLNKQVVGLALAIGLGLLGLSLFVANERWVTLGGLRFQASEPLKFAIPLLCGVSLARTSGKVRIREHPWLLLITAGVAAAIAIQDLGSAALVLGTLVMLLFAAGADWRWLPAGIITLGWRSTESDASACGSHLGNRPTPMKAPNSPKVCERSTKEDLKERVWGKGCVRKAICQWMSLISSLPSWRRKRECLARHWC